MMYNDISNILLFDTETDYFQCLSVQKNDSASYVDNSIITKLFENKVDSITYEEHSYKNNKKTYTLL